MKEDKQKEKIKTLIKRSEKYFYWYLLSHDKKYIDRFFKTTKKLKRFIKHLLDFN